MSKINKHCLNGLLNSDYSNLFQAITLPDSKATIYLMRLDTFCPKLSGNKYFKLKYNLIAAVDNNIKHIVSFGGAHSNHLFALANACDFLNIKLTVIVRGEKTKRLSPTLQFLEKKNVDCVFVSRKQYQEKNTENFLQQLQKKHPQAMIIPEGGSNHFAIKGCAEIVTLIDEFFPKNFSILALPCGTLGTFSGVASVLPIDKTLLGFSALKISESDMQSMLKNFLHADDIACDYQFLTEFHGGAYAKVSQALFDFVARFEALNAVPLDYIYVAKMLYGLDQMFMNDRLDKDETLIAIHTGGLQGRDAIEARYRA